MLILLAACSGPHVHDQTYDSGGADACFTGHPVPDTAPDESTAAIVVGGGPAGLSAAYELEEAGVPYVLVEREDAVGGAARWAGGTILFAGSPEQAAAGVTDSADALLADWEAMSGGDPDAPWLHAYAAAMIPEVHDWLTTLGLTFSLSTVLPEGGTTRRIHRTEGEAQAIVDAIDATLDFDHQRLGREVTALVCDGDRVAGVEWREEDETGWTAADAVVLATGGFLRDLDRVLAARPEYAEVALYQSSSPLADGSGLTLVESAGGTTSNLGAIGLYAHGTPDYRQPDTREELLLVDLSTTVWVDATGARFVDESRVVSFDAGKMVAALPGGSAWMLWDADTDLMIRDPLVTDGETTEEPTFDAAIAAARDAFSADTIAELATKAGIPSEALEATVAAYGAGTDAFGKNPVLIDPLDTPPFYAFRLVPTLAKGFGGVAVGLDGSVIDAAGTPIPGLYAAGELTGMAGGSLVGEDGAFTGSMSAVIFSGKVAGRAVATGR